MRHLKIDFSALHHGNVNIDYLSMNQTDDSRYIVFSCVPSPVFATRKRGDIQRDAKEKFAASARQTSDGNFTPVQNVYCDVCECVCIVNTKHINNLNVVCYVYQVAKIGCFTSYLFPSLFLRAFVHRVGIIVLREGDNNSGLLLKCLLQVILERWDKYLFFQLTYVSCWKLSLLGR